jgi:ETFB lysine methyltransferase
MSRLPLPPSLSRRFELANTALTIAGREYDLLRPRNIDELISEEDFDLDERIPYWADCWPSSRVLAERLLGEQGQDRRLLELGCGIGLASLAAAQAGFDVLATDYYAEALEFTSANAARHALGRIDTRLVDWHKLPDDLGRFDLVAASDVLYERPHPSLVASVLDRTLSADGLGLLTDPGRQTAGSFIDECAQLGLRAKCVDEVAAEHGDARLTVSVFEVRRGGKRI